MKKFMWEILVPVNDRSVEIPLDYHKQWDKKVVEIAGGLTIIKSVKGTWVSDDGRFYNDKMIPVRIVCTKEQIDRILAITLDHYASEMVILCYRISDFVLFKTRIEKT